MEQDKHTLSIKKFFLILKVLLKAFRTRSLYTFFVSLLSAAETNWTKLFTKVVRSRFQKDLDNFVLYTMLNTLQLYQCMMIAAPLYMTDLIVSSYLKFDLPKLYHCCARSPCDGGEIFGEILGKILGIFRGNLGEILGKSWGYQGEILGKS